jgi:hypothetical protein
MRYNDAFRVVDTLKSRKDAVRSLVHASSKTKAAFPLSSKSHESAKCYKRRSTDGWMIPSAVRETSKYINRPGASIADVGQVFNVRSELSEP